MHGCVLSVAHEKTSESSLSITSFLGPAYWKGSRRVKAVTKQDYGLLHGGECDDKDDDEQLPPAFISGGKS